MFNRLTQYARLMRLHKPKPILLLLWPTWWALWIAGQGHPSLKNIIIFTLGVLIMRSAGCVINDIADRHIDGKVARTQDRPLAAGLVSVKEALFIFVSLVILAFVLVLQLNLLTVLMAFPALGLAILYPFMKRYTYFPQVVLGMAWYLSVPMAFAAQLNTIPWLAWYLYIIAIIWAVIYDTFYALADREDDLKIGVKSTAILFGKQARLIIAGLQLVMILLLLGLGLILKRSDFYFGIIILTALYFIYQQYLTRILTPKTCIKAFLNNNWVGFWVFVGLLVF